MNILKDIQILSSTIICFNLTATVYELWRLEKRKISAKEYLHYQYKRCGVAQWVRRRCGRHGFDSRPDTPLEIPQLSVSGEDNGVDLSGPRWLRFEMLYVTLCVSIVNKYNKKSGMKPPTLKSTLPAWTNKHLKKTTLLYVYWAYTWCACVCVVRGTAAWRRCNLRMRRGEQGGQNLRSFPAANQYCRFIYSSINNLQAVCIVYWGGRV